MGGPINDVFEGRGRFTCCETLKKLAVIKRYIISIIGRLHYTIMEILAGLISHPLILRS